MGREKLFSDLLYRIIAFLNCENIDIKSRKMWKTFFVFFLEKIGREKVFGDHQDKKIGFLHYKNKR